MYNYVSTMCFSTWQHVCENYGSDDFKHNSFKYSHCPLNLQVHTTQCVGNCAYAIKTLFTHVRNFLFLLRVLLTTNQPENLSIEGSK